MAHSCTVGIHTCVKNVFATKFKRLIYIFTGLQRQNCVGNILNWLFMFKAGEFPAKSAWL